MAVTKKRRDERPVEQEREEQHDWSPILRSAGLGAAAGAAAGALAGAVAAELDFRARERD